jgi:hypothetical protein
MYRYLEKSNEIEQEILRQKTIESQLKYAELALDIMQKELTKIEREVDGFSRGKFIFTNCAHRLGNRRECAYEKSN